MNPRKSELAKILLFGSLIVILISLFGVRSQSAAAEPQTIVADAGDDIADFHIGEEEILDGSGSSGGSTLYYTWQVVAWPKIDINDPNDPGDPDHHTGDVGHLICGRSTNPICAISELSFFDADDVGTWTIQLTVDDGVTSATDDLDVTIKGFNNDDRWPTYSEGGTVNPIVSWIDWNTNDFYGLLTYTNIPYVTYAVGAGESGDGQHPDYEHEDRYMQAPLIPIIERLAEKVQSEGLSVIITEAWDSPGGSNPHSATSKHLEGRGVDIVPNSNPQDLQRIGRLAFLAQEVVEELGYGPGGVNCLTTPERQNGCVWVYHEHNHLHLSVRGQTAAPYTSGYHCDENDGGCLPHIYTYSGEFSGAAVGAMIVNWQGWTSTNEAEFYHHSGVQGWGNFNCEVMATTLNKYIDRGWTCVRTQTREEALRIAAYYMEHTFDQASFLGENTFHAFPIAIPMEGNYEHWVAIEGYAATADPNGVGQGSIVNPGGGTYSVGALRVVDPSVNSMDPSEREYIKRFVTTYELQGNIELDSTTISNLGLYYQATGPTGTYELVVPRGCSWTGYLFPSNTLAKSNNLTLSGNSVGQICDSRFSIINPPANSTVSTSQEVRVIALGPANAIDAYLTATENFEGGASFGPYSGTRLFTTLDFTGTVWEFTMWRPSFLSDYRLSVSADLGFGNEHCGSTIVTASSGPDTTRPQVSFLQPLDQEHLEVKQEYRIQVRVLDNQGIQKNSFNNDLVEVTIIHTRTGEPSKLILTTYELCGPNCYEFRWPLDSQSLDGKYQLTASATDIAGNKGYSNPLTIPVGQGDPVKIDSFSLTEGQTIVNEHVIKITADGGLGRLIANLNIQGPDPFQWNTIPLDNDVEEQLLEWVPKVQGTYTVSVTVYDQLIPTNQATVKRTVKVIRNDIVRDGEWIRLFPTTSPGVKNAAMVDTGNGVFLFGGQKISGGAFSNKLWKWDGITWADLTPPSTSNWPVARIYPQLTYDSSRGKLILFSGQKSDGTILRDVWEYTISSGLWTDRTIYPLPHFTKWPSPTFMTVTPGASRMTYDALHDRALLINSYSFQWNSAIGNWEKLDISGHYYDTIGYDTGRSVVVLYTQSSHLAIYEWDGAQWHEISIPSGGLQPSQEQTKMAGSPFGVYLIGGDASTKELWLWDGAVWTRIYTSTGTHPPNTNYYGASVAYDTSKMQLVVYTTNGQTWVYGSKLKNLVATPTLFSTRDAEGVLYGPGMALSWDPTTNTQAAYYEIQFSEDNGATWQILADQRDISYGGWINHHGNLDCGFGYGRCLKRNQTYSYRVRVLNSAKKPITGWSDIVSATSFDWPAHVEIEAQTPGPYQNGETVTMNLKNSYGQGMKVDWIISAWGGATATVVEGCGQGYNYKYLISQTCTLTISYQTVQDMQGAAKLAALEPPTSIYVTVKGTDVWGNTSYSNRITLEFQSREDPPRITKAEPMLYTDEYEPGKKYGPGMRLEWIHSPHPELAFYEIQFSEDGGVTWQVYMSARDAQWDWVNHHGNSFCEHAFYRCLKRNQVYHYRIRALDFDETPITDWSNIVSATSMEWPAHVEIAATPAGPQYPSNSVVTLNLVDTYGPGLQIGWEIFPHGQAQFTILDNTCQNGSFLGHAKVQQCKLRIWVNANTSRSDDDGSMKLAAPLLAYNSVRIAVTGTDSMGFTWTDDIDLSFKQSNDDPVEK